MHRLLALAGSVRLPPALAAAAAGGRGSAVAAVALAGGTVAYLRSYPHELPQKDPEDKRLLLDRAVMEMICGAIGEVAQVSILYPLETVKVRCQAEGIGAGAALRQLLAGGPVPALRAVYAGVGAAVLCSVVVGAVHYASFCMAKRAALAATGGADGGGGGSGTQEGATAAAAVVGAMATALVESPCDLYRHMAQAGVIRGNFLSEMAGAVRRDGIGALYWGFFAFCAESLPFDVVELGSYGYMQDTRDAALRSGDALGRRLAAVPGQVLDMAIGGAAGAAAVSVSMPFDVVKTYMQTHGAQMARRGPGGPWGEAVAFATTGAKLVRANGPGALFVGIVPRLMQQVPSSTICWLVIEQCRQLLEPYTRP